MMSSTRRSSKPHSTAFERFLSAAEFAARRPIAGNLVLPKALLYDEPHCRELAFFLQAMSMRPGGLKAVAERLVSWFPDRCVEVESLEACRLRFTASLAHSGESVQDRTSVLLAEFLIELILNPEISLDEITCPCFEELDGALSQFTIAHRQLVESDLLMTAVAKPLHRALDQALKLSRMVVVEGNAGVGKSTNAKAWCDARPGLARYISLSAITNRTVFFQVVGQAIGLATCQRKAQELQSKIEDFFAKSGLMLVIDEAHYLWPQNLRVTTSPELIDWIDTALVNRGVPVALVCTDQFSKLKSRVEKATGWTSEQFTRRVFRFCKLDENLSAQDVEALTKKLLSFVWDASRKKWISSVRQADSESVTALVHYAMSQPVPFSCVVACVDEARSNARDAGRDLVNRGDLREALRNGQIPSDAALSRAFSRSPRESRGAASQALRDDLKKARTHISASSSGGRYAALVSRAEDTVSGNLLSNSEVS